MAAKCRGRYVVVVTLLEVKLKSFEMVLKRQIITQQDHVLLHLF